MQTALSVISELEKFYFLRNPNEITQFLFENDFLIETLVEAPQHINRIFGEIPLLLELHKDPEENWDELFIVIKSFFSPEEALKKENRLIDEWFFDKIEKTRGKLNITEEPL